MYISLTYYISILNFFFQSIISLSRRLHKFRMNLPQNDKKVDVDADTIKFMSQTIYKRS